MASSSGVKICTEKNVITYVQPLESVDFQSELEKALNLWKSSIGAKGGIKLIVNQSGHNTLTSSSRKLFHNVKPCNPLILMIISAAQCQLQSYNDGGLYTAIMTGHLLLTVLKSPLSMRAKREIFGALCAILLGIINTEAVLTAFQVKVEKLSHVLPIVNGIVTSKPVLGFSQESAKCLSLQIVQAFLQTIPEDSTARSVGSVMLSSRKGTESEVVFNGFLYSAPEILEWGKELIDVNTGSKIPVLLFTFNLTNLKDSEDKAKYKFATPSTWNVIHEQFISLCAEFAKLEVKIVACQKVVDKLLVHYFRQKGILILERLGTEQTRLFQELTGAVPISSLNCAFEYRKCVGYLDSLECVDKEFLLLKNKTGNVATLQLTAWSEDIVDEMKVVCQQALDSMKCIVQKAAMVPGGGCFEVWLALRILATVKQNPPKGDWKKSEVLEGVRWFVDCLLHLSKSISKITGLVLLDSKFHHIWRSRSEDSCACGLVPHQLLSDADEWLEFATAESVAFLMGLGETVSGGDLWMHLSDDCVIDLLATRASAIKLSLETCENILKIGIMMFCT